MSAVAVTIYLPSEIAAQAQQKGIFDEDNITRLVINELERQERMDQLFNLMDQLAVLEPPLTPEEIEAEIQAVRAETR